MVETESKRCSMCKQVKPLDDFFRWKNAPDGTGRVHRCRDCCAKYVKELTPEQKERQRETSKRWYQNNRERVLPRMRAASLRKNYGLSEDEYASLLLDQNLVCAICLSDNPGKGKFFHVDHNHTTGEVRGLLCDNCNKGLGHFRENESTLLKAISYLSKWNKTTL